jgi:uncharacterized membrane protein YfcA
VHLGDLEVSGLLALGLGAGWLGALAGIGGGILVVPVLVLAFGIDIRIAVATSLVTVVATSTAAGSVYVGSGLANMRLGMALEIATTLGGITGGLLAAHVPGEALSGFFGVLMFVTAALMLRGEDAEVAATSPRAGPAPAQLGGEEPGTLAGRYWDAVHARLVPYRAERVPLGAAISFTAGVVSGMLGVGGGFLKVPAMRLGMRVPLKVAAATSNFMIGVTAIASFFVYFARGDVHPYLASAVTLGVVAGAFAGTLTAAHVEARVIQRVLVVVLLGVGVQMVLGAFGVKLGG